MVDQPRIVLPALGGDQGASWSALIEIAPILGDHWLLIGGQMALLLHVERHASSIRPTHDVDVDVDLRAALSGLAAMRDALSSTGFRQGHPSATFER